MRQLPIGPWIADFACRRARLIVELDGSQHIENARDAVRTGQLESDGWRVLRFWNGDVLANTQGVVEAIIADGESRLPFGEAFEFIASRANRARKPRSRAPKEPPPAPPRRRGGE